jgi:hypothetical protein
MVMNREKNLTRYSFIHDDEGKQWREAAAAATHTSQTHASVMDMRQRRQLYVSSMLKSCRRMPFHQQHILENDYAGLLSII